MGTMETDQRRGMRGILDLVWRWSGGRVVGERCSCADSFQEVH
jgi:hypothetical protein